jgi:hypothetical protein
VAYVVHRESLTFDEDNHMFAGYMMWKTGDYGLNPEHPPLAKLLATAPLLKPFLGRDLWFLRCRAGTSSPRPTWMGATG